MFLKTIYACIHACTVEFNLNYLLLHAVATVDLYILHSQITDTGWAIVCRATVCMVRLCIASYPVHFINDAGL